MGLTVFIETDNDAFAEDASTEAARLLRKAADQIERGYLSKNLIDINGNSVGKFEFDV